MSVDYSNRAHWDTYAPSAFGWGGRWDPERHPDLLVPFTFTTSRGETLNFGRMHRLAVPIFREFYTRLDRKHPGTLDGDPDEGCFNPNSVTENGDRSFHTYGIATDTDWNDNPMGVGVKRHGPHGLPDDTDEIGHPLGIQWGGTWTNFKDWMHNEIHLSPDDCIALARDLGHDTSGEFHVNADDKKIITDIVRQVVREEGNKGFNVRYALTWGGKWNTLETFVAGVPGRYTSIKARAAAAAKKAAKR